MKLAIIDRDGVINYDSDQYIKTPAEWKPIPQSLEAIARLNHAGYRVVVATNQSGVGRGLFDMSTLNAIHDKMYRALANVGGRIDALFFCPHMDENNCDCRKPKPGMLLDIAKRFNVDLKNIPFIGDSLKDLQAAQAVGAKPILVRTGKGEKTSTDQRLPKGTIQFVDLNDAVKHIISE
ncbi:MAG: D-glycero-beta-D-manno-heptose 1,7-bisphosphate 7-phosphatase [Burkholderiales bacterium]|jgi:D-glycero-D-manno-heptose 1,7-bisphosphate phosphatase|nr:D-glycero-beta-D-manno-heptose 1,7-bisphosphate 7-phosphatase [Pseudomonadota bacterium]MDA1011290.1 D-glycero-beta-D-manno-heptose 1,7-bisphosphate 7-phosphatase [Pseudomonadota bacterium]|tara:strand:- start:968 stop:1504 length:537 start_codon:yes stop_codon:yes gene_type:complete